MFEFGRGEPAREETTEEMFDNRIRDLREKIEEIKSRSSFSGEKTKRIIGAYIVSDIGGDAVVGLAGAVLLTEYGDPSEINWPNVSLGWERTWRRAERTFLEFAEYLDPRVKEAWKVIFERYSDFVENIIEGRNRDVPLITRTGHRLFDDLNKGLKRKIAEEDVNTAGDLLKGK